MRAGRWLVLVVALLVGAAAFAASDVPTVRGEWFAPNRPISEARTRAELRATRATLERSGYELVRTVSPAGDYAEVAEEIEVGRCVAVIAGAWGRGRVHDIVWVPRGARSRSPARAPATEPYRRVVVEQACPMRFSALDDRSFARMDVWLRGHGGAEILVLHGPAVSRLPAGTPLLQDRVVRVRRVWTSAISHALLAMFVVLLTGLMIESTAHTRRDRRDRERTLRRFTIALPAGLRGVLESIAPEGSLDPPAVRALRDQLASLAPLAHAAVLQRWRDDDDAVDARHARLCAAMAQRRADAKQSGYRAADDGLVAITILIRHRCELPELPARLDPAHLAFALESSLPRHDAELIDAAVIWHPRERTEALERAQLEALFPELVAIASGAAATCASCEAPVAGDPARCPACDEAYAPRAVDDRFDAGVDA